MGVFWIFQTFLHKNLVKLVKPILKKLPNNRLEITNGDYLEEEIAKELFEEWIIQYKS